MRKTLLSILILLSLVTVTSAQEHIPTVAGVPVLGTAESFSDMLERAGCRQADLPFTDKRFFSCTYGGVRDCLVTVSPADNGELLSVLIDTPPIDSWGHAESVFRRIKEELTLSYGAPVSEKEYFPREARKGRDKVKAIIDGKADMECAFDSGTGHYILVKFVGFNSKDICLTVSILRTPVFDKLPENDRMPEIVL